MTFGTVDFFEKHGLLFLFFITIFPRLTLLFSSVPFGGIFWWLGLIFAPRLLVAILATIAYFQTNPILVFISWFVAFAGESFEKRSIRNSRVVVHRFHGTPPPASRQPEIKNDQTIDVDFKRL